VRGPDARGDVETIATTNDVSDDTVFRADGGVNLGLSGTRRHGWTYGFCPRWKANTVLGSCVQACRPPGNAIADVFGSFSAILEPGRVRSSGGRRDEGKAPCPPPIRQSASAQTKVEVEIIVRPRGEKAGRKHGSHLRLTMGKGARRVARQLAPSAGLFV